MAKIKISTVRKREIEAAVQHYKSNRSDFDSIGKTLLMHLTEDASLAKLVHSGKYRSKDPAHLKDKLNRKEIERIEKKQKRTITKGNLFSKIHDLVGVRLLHLHTNQMEKISVRIDELFELNNYKVIEKPVVYIWDIENEKFFQRIGLKTKFRPEMYTSVHYVISPANRPDLRMELQVRTLMEEVWGEVSHTVNYPHKTDLKSCQEQLKVLARISSGCTRLVDSIFTTVEEHKSKNAK